MNDLITTATAYFDQISGGNQMIAGAISLWFMSVVTYAAKDIPKRVFEFIKRHTITSMTFNNGGYDETQMMIDFMKWIKPKISQSFSRTISLKSNWFDGDDRKLQLGIGYGIHFIIHNHRLFWIHMQKLESSGSERQKEEITISTIGRSHAPFYDIVDEMTPPKDETRLNIYRLDSHGEWIKSADAPKRSLSTIAASEELKKSLVDQIDHFKNNKEWFYSAGLPHKLTYILHGQPGTGKTSLIKAIASEYDMNVAMININQMSDSLLETGLASIHNNSIIVIEDFDSSAATKDRVQAVDQGKEMSFLTLTGLLNALDGIKPLDNCIVFMTTNHIEHIDPAISRKGRVDHIIEIGEVAAADVKAYSEIVYPAYSFDELEFNSVIGCKLNESLLYSKGDADRYVESLRGNGVVN